VAHAIADAEAIEVNAKLPLKTRDDLSMAYTSGVARVSMAIHEDPAKAWALTIKSNTVAVVSDGTAALGHGVIVCNRRVAESVANAAVASGVARRERPRAGNTLGDHALNRAGRSSSAADRGGIGDVRRPKAGRRERPPQPIANSIAPAEAGE
jgi:malic enzyme